MTMAQHPSHRPPPGALAARIGVVRFDADDVRAVEQVIARFAAEHQGLIQDAVADLHAHWTRATADLGREDVARCIAIAHDLAGFGRTLGYPLVTELCRSLNRYLRLDAAVLPRAREVVEIHLSALQIVALTRVTGDGGRIGREIADELTRAIGKFDSACGAPARAS
jgi:hypothetical protein